MKNLEIEDIRTAYPHATSVGILEAPELDPHKAEEVYPRECETLEEVRRRLGLEWKDTTTSIAIRQSPIFRH